MRYTQETYHVSYCPYFKAGIGIEPYFSRCLENMEPHPTDPSRRCGGYVFEEARGRVLEQLLAWRASMPMDGTDAECMFGEEMRNVRDADKWIEFWRTCTEQQANNPNGEPDVSFE